MRSISARLMRQFRPALAVGVSAAALALSSTVPAYAAVAYTVTDIGEFPTSLWTTGNGVNNSGQVSMFSVAGTGLQAGRAHNGIVTSLGTLGGEWSASEAINASGMVVGTSERVNGSTGAFISNGTTMIDLAPNSDGALAYAINNSNVVTGAVVTWDMVGGQYSERAAVWGADGAMTVLQAFANSNDSAGRAINASGVIVGRSVLTDDVTRVYATQWANGTVTDLGSLGGTMSWATGINDAGTAVGISSLAESAGADAHATMWKNGQVIDLDGMVGSYSLASAINADGLVVGDRWIGPKHYAFIHNADGMVDLNSLIAPGSGWDLQAARGISNNGLIVGFGEFNGVVRGFMLTPIANGAVPEPASWALMLGGMFMVSGVMRRSRKGAVRLTLA